MLKFIENELNLYKVTKRRYYTSYYADVEKRGRLSGQYYHLNSSWDWVEGKFADDIIKY